MLQSYKTKSLTIVDTGLFTELARTLAPYFGKVRYNSPWLSSFPASKEVEIMEGMDSIERINDIHEVIDETDLWVFPEIYYGPTQLYLQDIGKRVWGSRNGDELEIYRSNAKNHFKKLGISQGPWEVVKGITALRKLLIAASNKKKWVKIEKTRGDTETFDVEGYEFYKNRIDDLECRLGPKAEIMLFIVEDDLPDTIDVAIDTFSVDGDFPSVACLGTEEKNECYICVRKPWTEISPFLTGIYDKLSDTLKDYQYRNFLSLESRAKQNIAYLGDPCCRFGSPPSELQLNMIQNLPDIFWYGAEGKLIEPDIPSKHGVQLCVFSEWAKDRPLMVDFPKQYRNDIKFRYNSEFDGKTWIMPQGMNIRIASIVSHGNDLDACIEEVKEISGQIKGIQIEAKPSSFPALLDKIKTLKSWGMF